MFKNILQLYSLLVCLICVIVFLITGGGTVNSLIAIAMPEYIHSKTFYNSNDTYKRHYRETHNKEEWEDFKKLSLQEVTKQREEANASAKLHL